MYLHRNHYDNRSINVYCVRSIIVHRGRSALSLIIKDDKPPSKWFESPKKSGESVIGISDVVVEGQFIKFNKYISTLHPSSIYSKPVTIEEILNNLHIRWID